jgi:phenylalanyl-tRNA synthetase beta chain
MHAFEVESVEKVGDDEAFDIKVLPDRNHYALSHRGIAKEICAIFNLTFKDIFPKKEFEESKELKIVIEDEKLCRRYCGAYITNIKIGESPSWMKERLETIGQKSINNIVDITNYVMYGLGQPLHAFDADKLEGGITARPGKVGEVLSLLDATGVEDKKNRVIELGQGECVIADDSGPLVLAGIKGGVKTAIGSDTKNIILEAANFDPVITRKFSSLYNLRNESSKRFENEITPDYAMDGFQMCIDLILQISGGELEGVKDVYPKVFEEFKVSVSAMEIERLLGVNIPDSDIQSILKRFGFQFEVNPSFVIPAEAGIQSENRYVISVPSDRFDIRIREDLIEEIGRIYGYEHIESRRPEIITPQKCNKRLIVESIIRECLVSLGFSEVYTYVFQSTGDVELLNALASDKSFARNNIKNQLKDALVQNLRYADLLGLSKIKIFEMGSVFKKDGEGLRLSLVVGFEKKIKGETPEGDIQKVFGEICEALKISSPSVIAVKSGWDPTARTEHDGASRGQKIFQQKNTCDLIGNPSPEPLLTSNYQLQTSLEVDLEKIIELANDDLLLPDFINREIKKYQPISQYPFSVRDIAVWTAGKNNESKIEEIIKKYGGSLLKRVSLFDVFSKDGKTSYAYRLVLQSMEKTLEEAEINEIMKNITDDLNGMEGWEVR